MSYATVTPRDLLNIDPNPVRIPVKEIVRRFGIGHKQAIELRVLASRAPEVLKRQAERLRA